MRSLDRAQPLPDGSRILHIGLPKAGSTTLQGALHAARPALTEHGVLLAGRGRHHLSAAVAAVGQARTGHDKTPLRTWRRIATELREGSDRLGIFSSETLSRADAEHAARIHGSVGGAHPVHPVHIVIVARPLAMALPSIWQQALRNRGMPAFSDWVEKVTADPAESAAAAGLLHRFSLPRLIRTWGPVVGEDHITLIVLDPDDRGMLLDTFDQLLGLPAGTLRPQPRLANESLPYPEAELLRAAYQTYRNEGGTASTWVEDVAGWLRPGIRDLRAPGPGDRIRPPRWAVEAINETTAPWLDTIRGSGITVVGDLANLVADPKQYDELADPPTDVPIPSAAEMAYHFYRAGYQTGELRAREAEQASAPAAAAAPSPPSVAETPARELVREVGRRAVRRLLRRD